MTVRIEGRAGELLAATVMLALMLGTASSTSCIIPDKGIVAAVDCGSRWCATADFAEALDDFNNPVQVQEPKPGGGTAWVTGCICMTPAEDLVLRSGTPPMQYELLRNQVLDVARQACLDAAYESGYDPDPPYPEYELLDPTCFEAVTSIFRDGCCRMLSSECGTTNTCDADLDPTDGEVPGTSEGPDSADTTAADDSTGEMSSLEGLYDEVSCAGTTCQIGQPLIDAMLAAPEAVLAEGTSLAFAEVEGTVLGLEVRGVEPNNLAGRLGLRERDVIVGLTVGMDELPLTSEGELMAALERTMAAEQVTVSVRRDGVVLDWVLVRRR